MTNAMDYLSWRGDLSFSSVPVNEVDLFLCSQIITPDYTGSVPEDGHPQPLALTAERYFATHTKEVSNLGVIQSPTVLPMLEKLASCPRFADVTVSDYVNIVELAKAEQFAAATLCLPDGSVVIAFRGTDDTIVGWKEDFNLSVLDEIPAQRDAVDYVNRAAAKHKGPIYIVGHSKGGNLAVYSACKCGVGAKRQIVGVYSFDGPGFEKVFLEQEDYLQMKERIFTVVSQHSAVGMILYLAGTRVIVKSSVAGVRAHDGFRWYVQGPGFVRCVKMSDFSLSFHKALNDTLEQMTLEQRKAFIEQTFAALFSSGAETLTDMKGIGVAGAVELVKSIGEDEALNTFQGQVLKKLLQNYLHMEVKELKRAIRKPRK